MTTISSEHPTAQAKLEDLGYSYEELCEILAQWQNPPRVFDAFDKLSIDDLWERKGEAERHVREWSDHKGHIVAELTRRVKDAHPDFKPETGGSREIVGERIRVTMAYDKRYEINPDVILELAVLSMEENGPLNNDEYEEMVSFEAKVNGTKLNALARRGGVLADLLGRVRTLTGATPKFEAKAR